MKYTLNVYLNRVPETFLEDLEKARLYHEKHGVEFTFNIQKCDVRGYQSVLTTLMNGIKRYVLSGAELLIPNDPKMDGTMFVFDMGEWATPAGSQFPLRPDTPTGSCSIVKGKPFINIGTYPTEHLNGQTWIEVAHELMHFLVKTANSKGFPVTDVMDNYYLNTFPEDPRSNFGQQWELLKPFLATPKVTIHRQYQTKETLGTLSIDGVPFCKTLELPWKDNHKGVSCIPEGLYSVVRAYSPKHLKDTYLLLKVPNRDSIEIHSGNYAGSYNPKTGHPDIEGCILLGSGYADLNKDGIPEIINSTATVKAFEDKLGRQPFLLLIK